MYIVHVRSCYGSARSLPFFEVDGYSDIDTVVNSRKVWCYTLLVKSELNMGKL